MIHCTHCGASMPDGARFCSNCGKEMLPPPAGSVPVPTATVTAETADTYPSRFTGGAFAHFFIRLLAGFVSIITLTLAAPAMICWKKRWECRHTYIHGRQLMFDGKGIQLFGKWLLWLLLSVVTLTIYFFFCLPVAKEKWIASHTHFADNGSPAKDAPNPSKFDGRAIQLVGVRLLTGLVTVITLTLGLYWAVCYTQRWYKKHTVIDGCRFRFDGKGIQLFGKIIVWSLLTIITIGIYSFWYAVKVKKWLVLHTRTDDIALLPAISSAEAGGVVASGVPQQAPTQKSGLSIAGFILALFFPPIGLILSSVALAKKQGLRGLAIAGVILSVLAIVFQIIYIVLFYIL